MNRLTELTDIIRNRRSIKPTDMNGKKIDTGEIQQLLGLADWAPTHAMTEPWRFIVYENEARKTFCLDHAELYKQHTDPAKFTQGKYEKMQQQADTVSHVVLVYMKRTVPNPVPVVEEIAAVAAAVQNLLLGAAASGIAALWSTGGMTHHASMKEYLGLAQDDVVMGILFLGYTDMDLPSKPRKIALEDKVLWK